MDQNKRWYYTAGPNGDVVISTRIRLARNLTAYPFPSCMTEEQKAAVCTIIKETTQDRCQYVGKFDYMDMTQVPQIQGVSMVEKHLISPEFAKGNQGTALLLTSDESISLMVNEEDHIRLQVMRPGLMLDEAYDVADKLDTTLDEELHFAFDERLGYLTQCPSNLGTGMRASIMLHLPALEEKKALNHLIQTVSKLGLTIRGIYGEGSGSQGSIYQLSNQVSLGISEKAAIHNLKSIAEQIIREERQARESLCQNTRFVDRIWRSVGILSYAYTLTSDECMTLFSNVLMGCSTGILTDITFEEIHAIMQEIQPATLTVSTNNPEWNVEDRDIARAEKVRKIFRKDE